MLKTKLVSSQEKIFIDSKIDKIPALNNISALLGEVISLQLLYIYEGGPEIPFKPELNIHIEGLPRDSYTLRDVRMVPVDRPVDPERIDEGYIRTEPGLYPDLLTPLRYGGKAVVALNKLRSIWIEITVPEGSAGEISISVTLSSADGEANNTEFITLRVVPVKLPPQIMHFTQWFYCDCLANYYNTEPFSDKHFSIVEAFAKAGAKRGRDTLYTPLFTPPLNVRPEHERLPSQLIKVTRSGGVYDFDFSLVDKWVDMCDRIGIRYLEISHLYQQDNAEHAAAVYATVDGEYRRIFGFDTLALDSEYQRFLREMLTAFITHMKKRGDDKRCIFHISDEPYLEHMAHYCDVKNAVADILEGYTVIDALSDVDFYKTGVLDHPVPTTESAADFIEAGVNDLWVYYACNQLIGCSNCYVAMPSYRTRSLAFQLYKFNITGFLHWGYNFYNNRGSGDAINPYIELSGENWVPAGDTFIVYPNSDGTPLESIRMMTLEEVMQDVRAMQLCEQYYSHGEVVAAIEEVLGFTVTFLKCAASSEQMLAVREKINQMIEKADDL